MLRTQQRTLDQQKLEHDGELRHQRLHLKQIARLVKARAPLPRVQGSEQARPKTLEETGNKASKRQPLSLHLVHKGSHIWWSSNTPK